MDYPKIMQTIRKKLIWVGIEILCKSISILEQVNKCLILENQIIIKLERDSQILAYTLLINQDFHNLYSIAKKRKILKLMQIQNKE